MSLVVDLMVPVVVAAGIAGAYGFGRWTDAVTEEATHGVVLVGAMVCATAAGIAYALLGKRDSTWRDGGCAGAPAGALGIGVRAWGAFLQGAAFGRVGAGLDGRGEGAFPRGSFAFVEQVRSGMLQSSAAASLPVYPVQLMEAGLCSALAWLLARRFAERRISGERYLMLGMGYAAIRFPLEFLRGDNPAVAGGMTFSQVTCVWVFAALLLDDGAAAAVGGGAAVCEAARGGGGVMGDLQNPAAGCI